jgi:glycosyltransferase involved in cell wall biosynthesis
MEALAARRPVVARDLPVLREVFGDTVGYAVEVADLADRLAEALVADSARAADGFALAAAHTWDAAARAHLDFYRAHALSGTAP